MLVMELMAEYTSFVLVSDLPSRQSKFSSNCKIVAYLFIYLFLWCGVKSCRDGILPYTPNELQMYKSVQISCQAMECQLFIIVSCLACLQTFSFLFLTAHLGLIGGLTKYLILTFQYNYIKYKL